MSYDLIDLLLAIYLGCALWFYLAFRGQIGGGWIQTLFTVAMWPLVVIGIAIALTRGFR